MLRHGFYMFVMLLAYGCVSPSDAQEPPPRMEAPPPEAQQALAPQIGNNPDDLRQPEPPREPGPPSANSEVILVADMLRQRSSDARPQLPSSGLPEPDSALVAAIRRELSINLPNGSTAPVGHCLRAGPRMDGNDRWQRCQRRVSLFAQYFQAAGAEHGVDPWVLAAMARRESAYYPGASGSVGEYGIMQLHPRGVGRDVRYVSNARFRAACRRVPGACQEEVVNVGADLLGRSLRHCGTIEAALGAYNTGRCGGSEGYTQRVLRVVERMRAPIE